MIMLRVIWEIQPGLLICILFWITSLYFTSTLFYYLKMEGESTAWIVVSFIGQLCNASVTISNGGFMPVNNVIVTEDSLWVAATNQHYLLFLADNYSGFSIGDFIIFSGFLIGLLTYLIKFLKRGVYARV